MIGIEKVTGIILAGGKSSRMGTDKGFLKLNNRLFIKHIINAIKPLVSEIIIVSDNKDYDVFGLKRVEDDIKNAGPLSGVHSGLKTSKTQYNLVLSCDIPLITTKILKKLLNGIDKHTDIIQIVSQGKSMPLIALYKKQCETVFFQLLHKNERRMYYAINQCNLKTIVLQPEEEIYTRNINTPEDFKKIESLI